MGIRTLVVGGPSGVLALAGLTTLAAAPAGALHEAPPPGTKAGEFACTAWATGSDSAATYLAGPDQYPVGGTEWLPGWNQAGVSSYPCRSDSAAVTAQTIPLSRPDGTRLATVTVGAGAVETARPVVRAPGELGPVVGDGGDAWAHPINVTIEGDGVDISVTGLWAGASARCQSLGQLPAFASRGGVGTVTVNGQERTVGSAPIRVGPVGLRFHDVRTWGDEHWGGLHRYAMTVELYPEADAVVSATGLAGRLEGGASVEAYSRTFVGFAGVVRIGNPCSF